MKNTDKIIFEGYPKEMMVCSDNKSWKHAIVLCETIGVEYPFLIIENSGIPNTVKFSKNLPKLKKVPLEPSIEMLDWKIKNASDEIFEIHSIGKVGIGIGTNCICIEKYEGFMLDFWKYQPKDSKEWFPCYKEVEVEE